MILAIILSLVLISCKTNIRDDSNIPLSCKVAEWCGNNLKDTTACGPSIIACSRISVTMDCYEIVEKSLKQDIKIDVRDCIISNR